MRDPPSRTVSTSQQYSLFDRARAREFADHYSFIVTKRLIKGATKKWDAPCRDLTGEVYKILVREVNEMLDSRFHAFQYGGLHQRVK